MYAIEARWQGNPGSGDVIADYLRQMMIHVQEEPGCVLYACNRDPTDPDLFMLYEQYIDEAAFTYHCSTEPFKEIVLGQIVPMLTHRKRLVWETIDSSS